MRFRAASKNICETLAKESGEGKKTLAATF